VGLEEGFFGQSKIIGIKDTIADHEFSAKNALLPAEKCSTGMMVGNANSAFVSRTRRSPEALKKSAPLGLLSILPPLTSRCDCGISRRLV
jgi:hypothetical protein